MNAVILGRKIKEARLAKKMTQSELAGTFVTRNMISQIESGAASPSIKTLEYIAQILEMSVAELTANSETDPMQCILLAKAAYKANNYNEVISLLGEPKECDMFYDESCALLARAYRAIALSSNNSEYEMNVSKHYASLGIYAEK